MSNIVNALRWLRPGKVAVAGAILSLLSCSALSAARPSEQESATRTLIRNVTLVPMEGAASIPRRDILVSGDRIVAIERTGRLKIRTSDRIVEGAGKYLMPGLWDMHAHVTVPSTLDDENPPPATIVGERLTRYLGYGVSGVRDTGSTLPNLVALRAEMKLSESPLPRLVASGPLLDGPKQRWTNKVALPLDTVEDASAAVERLAEAGVDFLKVYETVSAGQFRTIMAAAKARGLPVVGHIPFAVTAEQGTAAGMAGIEHVYVSLVKDCLPGEKEPMQSVLQAWIKDGYAGRNREAHRIFAARDRDLCQALFKRLASRGTFVTPVLSMEMKGRGWTTASDLAALSPEARAICETEIAAFDKGPDEDKRLANSDVLEIVRQLHQAGVGLLAGPDAPGACISFGHSLHRELQLLVAAGLSPLAALKTATVNPARFLGRADEGVARKGAMANLLLLDADPLADISNTLRIGGVMLEGHWFGPAELDRMRGGGRPVTTVYENANVWTGTGFEPRELATEGGRFVPAEDISAATRRIDLKGGFVIPAFGNAHQHITNPNPKSDWAFLKEGVFYVWNPNSIILSQAALDFYARPETSDVAVSQGGITEPGGHPEKLYVDILSQYAYKGMGLKEFLGNAFHYGRTASEIDSALDLLVSQKANFVKAYLLHSEEYARRRIDPVYYGNRGLNPVNIPYLVAAARRRGLPVVFHVETVSDLRLAALSGAAAAGHLPAYGMPAANDLASMTLTRADAERIAGTGIKLIPTYGFAAGAYAQAEKDGSLDRTLRRRHYEVQASNIRLLNEAGATFLIGTDGGPAIYDEAEHLAAIGGLSEGDALRMVLKTGQLMFPERRIGCFEPGCEADFLVLAENPSIKLAALRTITMRVKAGREVKAPDGE